MFFLVWWQKWRVRRLLARKACDFAKAAFASAYPDEELAGLRVLAVEEDRVVIAVFLKTAHSFRGTPPYLLFAVMNDLSRWEELPKDSGLPYVLRGIK